MTVTLLCPACGRPITAGDLSPRVCPHCGSVLPDALVTAVHGELQRELAAKPTLLRLLPPFLGVWALIALPLSLSVLLSSGGTYKINDVAVTRDEFMRRVGPIFVMFPVFAVVAGLLAWGLYRDRRWSRPLATAFGLGAAMAPQLAVAGDPELGTTWPVSAAFTVLIAVPLVWYFYYKSNVVRYYASILDSGGGTQSDRPGE